MTITVDQLAMAVNNLARITPASRSAAPGMTTWEIDVINQYGHIIDRSYHTGWFQEEAERIAMDRRSALQEASWQVLPITRH